MIAMTRPTASPGSRWSLHLAQTKVAPPRPVRIPIPRDVPMAKLRAGRERALTVVAAPAGFGKTSLLVEWYEHLRQDGQLVAWLSLDDDDNDIGSFAAYLVAAIHRAAPDIAGSAQDILRQDALTPIGTVLSVLLNSVAASSRRVYLILDDFDRLSSEPVRHAVARLLRYRPPNFYCLVGVRSEPGLPLSQFYAAEQLLRIDADDLRLSCEQTSVFIEQVSGIVLDEKGAAALHRATEGWAAGLQLASLAIREAGDAARLAQALTGARRSIDAFLNEAVLTTLPPPVLDFMLRTSILDRLSPDLCDTLIGERGRGWETLEWLERHNVFLRPLDDEREWFSFHSLLRDSLRRRARRQLAVELPGLHRRASRWHAGRSDWVEAVRHALAAGDFERAAEWVEICGTAMVDRSDVRTLLGWLAELPRGVVRKRPRLRLIEGWALALSLRTVEAAAALSALEADVAHAPDAAARGPGAAVSWVEIQAVSALIAGLADDSRRSLELGAAAARGAAEAPGWVGRFAETALIFGLLYDGAFGQVAELCARVPPAAEQENAPLYANIYRASMIGLSALVEGRLKDATELFEAAFARADGALDRRSAAAALPAGYLAELYLERDEPERAREMVELIAESAFEVCPLGSLMRYCRAAAGLRAGQGDLGAALLILQEASRVADHRQWPRLRAAVDAEAVRLCVRHGRLEQARDLAEGSFGLVPSDLPAQPGSVIETWTYRAVTEARIALANDRPDVAAALLDGVCDRLSSFGMRHLHARATLLLAVADEHAGFTTAAEDRVRTILAYAENEQMVRSFLDEGPAMQAIFSRLSSASRQPCPAFARRILAAFERDGDRPVEAPWRTAYRPSELLSPREIEILHHVAQGGSNKQAGRALRLAPETVKWHLKNIYEKLSVSSRMEAVRYGLRPLRGAAADVAAAPEGVFVA